MKLHFVGLATHQPIPSKFEKVKSKIYVDCYKTGDLHSSKSCKGIIMSNYYISSVLKQILEKWSKHFSGEETMSLSTMFTHHCIEHLDPVYAKDLRRRTGMTIIPNKGTTDNP